MDWLVILIIQKNTYITRCPLIFAIRRVGKVNRQQAGTGGQQPEQKKTDGIGPGTTDVWKTDTVLQFHRIDGGKKYPGGNPRRQKRQP